MSTINSIHYSAIIYNRLKKLNFGLFLSDIYMNHLMAVILSVFLFGYKGKTVNFARASQCHRTTIAHFPNHGKWDSSRVEDILKASVVRLVYQEAVRSGKPVLCIADDTIASHTKPSSQAAHPIEAAYFHQSHLKGCQDYGHQAVSVMLSCNGITLNYAIILYDKSKSKIRIVQETAEELPEAPVLSYFLCDSWYTTAKVMDCFIRKGFYTIGALKTNRIIYPCGIRQKISEFACYIRKGDPDVSLVTVGGREFHVYRYEGELHGILNAAVILRQPKALRVFLSTDTGLTTQEILDTYIRRWPIEIFFRQGKNILALDRYQIRSRRGIQRYWLIMSLVHYICCTCKEECCTFEEGYRYLQKKTREESVTRLYQSIQGGKSLEDILELVG